jgi:hypothetical protein
MTPDMAQDEGGKWGLGVVIKDRKDNARITLIEVLMTLHKDPIASRPISRAYHSQMKEYEHSVAGILTQVLEDIEDERVKENWHFSRGFKSWL